MTGAYGTVRDVVVVGSGHNALVTACYLARAGLDVEVVERDTVIGGAVSTVERIPGYLMDRGSSVHVMVRMTGIVEDLDLAAHGLRYVDMDPWGFVPFDDPRSGQKGIHFHVDLDATCASIAAAVGEADAAAYRRFATDWRRRNEAVFEAFHSPARPGALARAMWGAGRGSGRSGLDLAQDFLTTADALLDRHFRDERLKAGLAWIAAQSGPPPHEVATADLLGWNMMLHARAPGRAVGGSGALTAALAARLRSDGGAIRTGDGAARIVTDSGGRALGVVTASGDRIAARAVVAGGHVATMLGLLDHSRLPGATASALVEDRSRLRIGDGLGMAVRVALRVLPRYPAGDPTVGATGTWGSMQFLCPSRGHLRAAYADFLSGRLPNRPAVLVMTSSALDPGIAPPGMHSATLWGQWHPYRLADGLRWDDVAEKAAEDIVAEVDAFAPGFADSVVGMHVQTPADLERELGMLRGNVMHLEMGLDAMFAFRPTPRLSGHRVPGVPGLYLTGASTHPGGGVSGASGRIAAEIVLRDWRRLSRRRLPSVARAGTHEPRTPAP